MKGGLKALLAIIVVLVIIALPIVGTYNSLVNLELKVNSAQADIDTDLQRRSDLIPNFVETVKGYASHENEIFTQVAESRAKLAGAQNVTEQAEADASLSSALSRLLVVVENYPELKANQNFRDLTVELEGTENRIAVKRQDYNTAVTQYNSKRRRFPSNIVASLFGFEEKPLYKAAEGAKEVPKVDFGV
ncbi:LemA family protein [Clostridium sp.]|uniref:LemA family protein n=1 Tax=Clostridium sp. TaxID=1506 RepID=UPI002FCBE6D9